MWTLKLWTHYMEEQWIKLKKLPEKQYWSQGNTCESVTYKRTCEYLLQLNGNNCLSVLNPCPLSSDGSDIQEPFVRNTSKVIILT